MKINRLYIKNIASITEATIDFTTSPLRDERLILISGNTGAGKSTILDAICLALYNKTPRLEQAPPKTKVEIASIGDDVTLSSPLHLVRRTSSEARAELQFTGNDGQDYTASWVVERKTRQSKALRTPENSLIDAQGNVLATRTEALKRIGELVGMDFTQFCRTTMLAQGEFTRFLRSNESDKSSILMRLTHTERFEQMGRRIYELYNSEVLKCSTLSTECATIEAQCLDNEQVTNLTKQLAEGDDNIRTINEQAAALDSQIKWIEQRDALAQQRERVQKDIDGNVRDLYVALLEHNAALMSEIGNYAGDNLTPQQTVALINADIAAATRQIETLQTQEKQAGEQYEACHVDDITAEMKKLDQRIGDIGTLDKHLATADERTTKVNDCATAERQAGDRLQELELQLPVKQRIADAALEAYNVAKAAYDNVHFTIENAVNQVRSHVHCGDECPVCGNRIENIRSNEHYTPILQPLASARDTALNESNRATTDVKALQLSISSARSTLSSAKQATARAQNELKATNADIDRLKQALGIAPDTADLAAAIAALKQDIAKRREQLEATRRHAEEIQRHISELVKQRAAAVKLEQSHNDRLTKFNDMVALQSEADEALTAATGLRGAWTTIEPSDGSGQAARVKPAMRSLQSAVDHVNGELNSIAKQEQELENTRPANAAETPADLDRLREQLAEQRATAATLTEQMGSWRTQIESDKTNRERLKDARDRLEAAQRERDRYARLCACFGSADGKKMRTIALGLILGDLLRVANSFLRQFDEHYELYNNGDSLTIMMRDRLMGNTESATTNLSGGESFMVSLALALALARTGSNIITADTLFIDEGFGSLSDDVLENVINALEHLHQASGQRVVIISHVAELQERIAARIHVAGGRCITTALTLP